MEMKVRQIFIDLAKSDEEVRREESKEAARLAQIAASRAKIEGHVELFPGLRERPLG